MGVPVFAFPQVTPSGLERVQLLPVRRTAAVVNYQISMNSELGLVCLADSEAAGTMIAESLCSAEAYQRQVIRGQSDRLCAQASVTSALSH